jgi:pyridoxamine 5'-phosphate oxidase
MSLPWPRHLPDPFPPSRWSSAAPVEDATRRAEQPNPNSMVVATVDAAGVPSARVVLCKEIRPVPGIVTFYSNYESHKGQDLAANPRAAIVMHWDHRHRQLRIEGPVVRASAEESDAYFRTRAWQRRIGAWASRQSQPIASRGELYKQIAKTALRLAAPDPGEDERAPDPGVRIPRPPYWGGYHVWAEAVELWCEGSARITNRRWTRRCSPRLAASMPGRGLRPGCSPER